MGKKERLRLRDQREREEIADLLEEYVFDKLRERGWHEDRIRFWYKMFANQFPLPDLLAQSLTPEQVKENLLWLRAHGGLKGPNGDIPGDPPPPVKKSTKVKLGELAKLGSSS